jgi:hypothetical protein
MSTNPKPRLRLVSRSTTIFARFTSPYGEKISTRSASVVAQGRLPTKTLTMAMVFLLKKQNLNGSMSFIP